MSNENVLYPGYTRPTDHDFSDLDSHGALTELRVTHDLLDQTREEFANLAYTYHKKRSELDQLQSDIVGLEQRLLSAVRQESVEVDE